MAMTNTFTTLMNTSTSTSEQSPMKLVYEIGIPVALFLVLSIVIATIIHTRKVRKRKERKPPKPPRQRRKRSSSSRKRRSRGNYDVSMAGFDRAWAGHPRQEAHPGQYIFDDSSSGYLSLQGSEAYQNFTHEDFGRWSDRLSLQNDVDGYLMPMEDYNCIYVNVADLFRDITHGASTVIEESILTPISERIMSKSISSSLIVHPTLPTRLSIESDEEESEDSEDSKDSETDVDYIATPFCLEPSRIRSKSNPQEQTNPRWCQTLRELRDGYITAV